MPTMTIPIITDSTEPEEADASIQLELEPGTSTIFVGPNGSGKTRLGVLIEAQLSQQGIRSVRRVAAQRGIALNDRPRLLSFEESQKAYYFGNTGWNESNALQLRYSNIDPAIKPLADFDAVLQALYAEQAQVSVKYTQQRNAGNDPSVPRPKFEKLRELWTSVLPLRELNIEHGHTLVTPIGGGELAEYEASKLSDGERVIFYMLGQALLAEQNTVLIVDEPELHIHKAILARLWDEIEGARPDLAFVYVTHDLEFASTRSSANIYGIEEYSPIGPSWRMVKVDPQDQFPDSIALRIIGSRQNVLFVEGETDAELFRAIFPEMNIISVGNHQQVITCTKTFNTNRKLHHKRCFGIVDRDGRSIKQVESLEESDVYVLPVSELENLFLLPAVWRAVLEAKKFEGANLQEKLDAAKKLVMDRAADKATSFAVGQAKRVLDRKLKSMGLNEGEDKQKLQQEWSELQSEIDIVKIVEAAEGELQSALESEDLEGVLRVFDDKSMLNDVITAAFGQRAKAFKQELLRILHSDSEDSRSVKAAIRDVLPVFSLE